MSAGFDLKLSEALLEYFAARYASLGFAEDMDRDGHLTASSVDNTRALRIHPLDLSYVRSGLLSDEISFEINLAESFYSFDVSFDYGFVAAPDIDGDVQCWMGAAVGDNDGARFVLELCLPVIDRVVLSGDECPLADRIRLATYFVRVCGDAVSRIGLDVGVFGYAIGVLRDLVGRARLEQGDEARDGGDDGDTDRDPVHNSSSSVGSGVSGAGCQPQPTEGEPRVALDLSSREASMLQSALSTHLSRLRQEERRRSPLDHGFKTLAREYEKLALVLYEAESNASSLAGAPGHGLEAGSVFPSAGRAEPAGEDPGRE